jgi:hypothetical protein
LKKTLPKISNSFVERLTEINEKKKALVGMLVDATKESATLISGVFQIRS